MTFKITVATVRRHDRPRGDILVYQEVPQLAPRSKAASCSASVEHIPAGRTVSTSTKVQRLRNSDSLYSIYTEKLGLVSKGTARKIRDLFVAGKLNFVLELENTQRLFNQATEAAEELTVEDQPWNVNIAATSSIGVSRRSDAIRARFEDIRHLLPIVPWNIGYFERSGVPLNVGLQLLVEHDLLEQRMANAEWSKHIVQRFIALHFIVEFYLELTDPPYGLIDKAATAYARGLMDNNEYLRRSGEGLVRYQVWRGSEFFSAYDQAQQGTYRMRSSMRRWSQEVEESLAEMEAEHLRLKQTWNAVVAAEKGIMEKEPDEFVRTRRQDEYSARLREHRTLEAEIIERRRGPRIKEAGDGETEA